MLRFDVSKVLFVLVVTTTVLSGSYFLGMRAGAGKTTAYYFWTSQWEHIAESLRLTKEEAPTLTGLQPTHFLQPRRYRGEGVTVNDPAANPRDLILLSGFFDGGNEVRLIRRDGEPVARWPLSFLTLFPNPDEYFQKGRAPVTDWNIDTHGALALPDGAVVFNFDYGGTAKLDRCNTVVWTLRRQTHHSLELADGGGFIVPGRRYVTSGTSPYPPFVPPFAEDLVLTVSGDGRVVSEFSVVKLLHDQLKPILTATGTIFSDFMVWDHEIVHLNKVDQLRRDLAADFPMFEAGDLLLSIRELNLLLVTDAAGTTVKWWQIGPWLRQHDPEFARGGRILVFNNNIFWNAFGTTDKVTPADTPRQSQVMAVDPATGRTETLYGGAPDREILSVLRGKVEPTDGGGLLITEADGGRVREVDATGRLIWEYVNAYSDDEVAEVTEARVYPAGYFTFDTGAWPCPNR